MILHKVLKGSMQLK